MLSTEQVLEQAAQDGSIDISEWPRVLEEVLQRLHEIVYNDFPIPSIPLPAPSPATIDPEVVASTPPRIPTSDSDPQGHDLPDADDEPNSQGSTKENDAPTNMAAGRPPSLSSYLPEGQMSASQQTEEMPPPPSEGMQPPRGTLPPDLLSAFQTSERMLRSDFAESPPYTIQRLAELVLRPKRHYRFLPAYLRALDRVVSVSSPASDFPLPTLHASSNGGFLTNGEAQTNGLAEREGLGSDESLGGALLTPIPWLRHQNNSLTQASSSATTGADGELHSESTETIDGPHGAGSIETVSVTVNGVSSTGPGTHTPSQSPCASPTLSEQSDASTNSASSTEAQLREQGGVTQGELLRKEQEAGIVPVDARGVPMTSSRRHLLTSGAAAVGREAHAPGAPQVDAPLDNRSEELPHARGPDVIGMEDMGPQQHPMGGGMLDMEAAVGRGRSKSPQPPPKPEEEEVDAEKMEGVAEPEQWKQGLATADQGAEKSNGQAQDEDGDTNVGDAAPILGSGDSTA